MEVNLKQTLIALTALALLPVALAQAQQAETSAGPAVKGRQFTPPSYVFSPDIPADLVTQNVGAIGLQVYVDNMAWDSFIALNWPAPNPIVERGVPDRENVIGGFTYMTEGGPKTMPTGPVVWETYKDSDDIYLDPPVRPAPFDAAEKIPPQCLIQARENPAAARRTLVRTAKISDVLIAGDKESDGNRLVDQNGQNVWYEVKLNRVYYDYVVSNKFYDSRNQSGAKIAFPASSNTTDRSATVKVKAAWKVMGGPGSKQPDDATRFYTTDALVFDPATKRCDVRKLGLVGLHVVIKTDQLPQWMWATFEQVDNAPTQGQTIPTGARYNFFNPACTDCKVNQPPAKGSNTPTQVMRVIPLDDVAAQKSVLYQTALKTLRSDNVWQYYRLVNAQWAGKGVPIGTPTQPPFLANTTLETYMQGPQQPNGCINCHGKFAGTKDLDFQLFDAYPRKSKQLIDLFRVPGATAMKP
ncbi:conserved exported protein of unknown function [Bradyrhizobium sp. ORS 285]|nr:conserved exported hypothetical protein [Bradyrhizobium sp. ORS 285]SMX56252.1 conserved exported protein of unknown function [Bradyrhizobium sp. ORS 285]